MCKGPSLRRIIYGLVMWMITGCMVGYAQEEKHFVYIQSDQHQLFYVKLNNQIISANPPGYVVLSPVPPGKLDIVIGFPRNEYPEQRYQLNLPPHQDKGYLLKRINDQEFALYDLHQYTELKPVAIAQGQGFDYPLASRADTQINPSKKLQAKSPGPIKDTTPNADQIRFRQLLMAAATAGQPEESISIAHIQKPISNEHNPAPGSEPAPDTASRQAAQEKPKAIYQLTHTPQTDTLQAAKPVFTPDTSVYAAIPAETNAGDTSMESILQKLRRLADEIPSSNKDSLSSSTQVTSAEQNVASPDNPMQVTSATSSAPQAGNQPPLQFIQFDTTSRKQAPRQHIAMINSDCAQVLDEKQFEELRNKVAAQRSDAAMLKVVQRNLKNRCFTTHQVEILVYLFTTESYRYRFVEWVYPHVADSEQFKQLIRIFPDDAYQARFRSLIRQ
ncbi:protein of unknown function [Thermoflavifilum thermophilum]|uniref:DUF4476 domain-containing protein n=2 Tax=Thermoflavifilum thermophilum TaxID=1393122 RepID=A0A1I7NFG3_9BACT|nr:protein of unknown function [Thermoflavifilum thermophilum]